MTLRKEKKKALLDTKRKSYMLKAFERTMGKSGLQPSSEGHNYYSPNSFNGAMSTDAGGLVQLKIGDEQTLEQIIHNICNPMLKDQDRELWLESLRYMTVHKHEEPMFVSFVSNPATIPNILNIIKNACSGTQNTTTKILKESLWILTNLACERQIPDVLIEQYQVFQIMQ